MINNNIIIILATSLIGKSPVFFQLLKLAIHRITTMLFIVKKLTNKTYFKKENLLTNFGWIKAFFEYKNVLLFFC